jgi:hypothetical protein
MELTLDDRSNVYRRVIRGVIDREAFNCHREETPLQFTCMSYQRSEQAWLDKMIQTRHTKQPGIIYGFYESPAELQAYAIETPTETPGFIAISTYCIVSIGNFIRAALAHRNILLEFGDPEKELSSEEMGSGPHVFVRPRDPERLVMVKVLSMMAMRFLTAHEMTHILNGHIRHRLAGHLQGEMAEARRRLTPAEALFSQTLEMDADAGAVVECMPGVILAERDLNEIIRIGCHPVFQKAEAALRLWLFAVYCVFRDLEDVALPIPLELASHPPPMMRIRMVMGTLYEFLKREKLDRLMDLLPSLIEQTIIDGENAYASILNQPVNFRPLATTENEESQLRITAIINAWRDVRPIVEPFARGGGKLAPLPEM